MTLYQKINEFYSKNSWFTHLYFTSIHSNKKKIKVAEYYNSELLYVILEVNIYSQGDPLK